MLKTHCYFKLLAVKAAIVEDIKTLSQHFFPVAQQSIVQLAATNERYANFGWDSDYND